MEQDVKYTVTVHDKETNHYAQRIRKFLRSNTMQDITQDGGFFILDSAPYFARLRTEKSHLGHLLMDLTEIVGEVKSYYIRDEHVHIEFEIYPEHEKKYDLSTLRFFLPVLDIPEKDICCLRLVIDERK